MDHLPSAASVEGRASLIDSVLESHRPVPIAPGIRVWAV
jgi:hypothetical protein